MSKIKLDVTETQRECVCRYCTDTIPRGKVAFVMKHVHVSPNFKDLWFHIECMIEINKLFRQIKKMNISVDIAKRLYEQDLLDIDPPKKVEPSRSGLRIKMKEDKFNRAAEVIRQVLDG